MHRPSNINWIKALPLGQKADALGKVNLGIGIWSKKDDRTFPEMLTDWMLAMHCIPGNDNASFLNSLFLTPYISADQWQELLDGKRYPNKNLALCLSLAFEESTAQIQDSLPTPTVFHNRVMNTYLRGMREPSSILSITRDQYADYREPVIYDLCNRAMEEAADPWPAVEKPSESPDPALTVRILGTLHKYGANPDHGDDEALKQLARRYRQMPDEIVQALGRMLEIEDPAQPVADTVIKEWAESVLSFTSKPSVPAQLLKYLRRSRGLSLVECQNASKLNYTTWWLYDTAGRYINTKHLGEIQKALNLEGWEYEALKKSLMPGLDPRWLENKPVHTRSGLLLRALRNNAKLTQMQLSIAIDVSAQAVDTWEHGINPINPYKLQCLQKALSLSDTDMQRLTMLVRPELDPEWVTAQIMQKQYEHLSFPELDEKYLQHWQPQRQAGKLLAAFRARAGLTQGELGTALSVSDTAIDRWENAHNPIDPFRLHRIHKALALNDTDIKRLTLLVRPELAPEWIDKKIAAKLVEHLSFPVLDHEYLAGQPADKRFGMLMGAFRERLDLWQWELAHRLSVIPNTINAWENAHWAVPAERGPQIAQALALNDAEVKYLIETWRVSAQAIRHRDGVKSDITIGQDVGPTWPPIPGKPLEFPGYSGTLKPREKIELCYMPLGELMKSLRERASLEPEFIAGELGVMPADVKNWERGKGKISMEQLVDFSTLVKAPPEALEDLTHFRILHNRAQLKSDWVERTSMTPSPDATGPMR